MTHHHKAEPPPNPAATATSSSNDAGLRANNADTPHKTTRAQRRSLSKNSAEKLGTMKKKIAHQYNSVAKSEKVKSLIARDQSCFAKVFMLLARVTAERCGRPRAHETGANATHPHSLEWLCWAGEDLSPAGEKKRCWGQRSRKLL